MAKYTRSTSHRMRNEALQFLAHNSKCSATYLLQLNEQHEWLRCWEMLHFHIQRSMIDQEAPTAM